ncbi:MAG: tetratricopeptide repeat protein [Verrucomicrobiota bacterium]
MKQRYNTQLAFTWVLLATLFLAGCGGGEKQPDAEETARVLAAANELLYEGEVFLAIEKLEVLEMQMPNNPEVVEALAFAYAKQPDPDMAAIYFDQAYNLDPTNVDLALYAATAYTESENFKAAAQAYRKYLRDNPDDSVALKALARAETEQKHHKSALDAYLEAFRQSQQQPTPEEAATVGHLYHALGNSSQASRWYQAALKPGAPPNDRLTAHLGLFDLALRAEDWEGAYALMEQIEAEAPGEFTAGPYASAGDELRKWKQAQESLADTRIQVPTSESVTETVEQTTQTAGVPPGPLTSQSQNTEASDSAASNEPATGDSAQSIGNLADIGDPATAKGFNTVDLTAELQDGSVPEVDGGLSVDDVTVETVDDTDLETAEPPLEVSTETIVVDAVQASEEAMTATKRGDIAYEAEDYASAIRYYRQAMADDTRNADLAYNLSRAYYNHGKYSEAELFASEAMRLDPNEVRYTLNYLRAIQRTLGREALMRELIRAKERFPNSPDVTLALGRAYEIFEGNTRNARFLYEEFLALAPTHPRAEDIRTKLRSLP